MEEKKEFFSEEEEKAYYIEKLKRLAKLPGKPVEPWMKEDPDEGDD